MTIEVVPLLDDARTLAAVDAILIAARPLLVPADGLLESARARLEDEGTGRAVFYAKHEDTALGVIDAAMEPGVLIVAQIAVSERRRHSGVGRALVRTAARWGASRGADAIEAHLLSEASVGFGWSLGFERVGSSRYRAPVVGRFQ